MGVAIAEAGVERDLEASGLGDAGPERLIEHVSDWKTGEVRIEAEASVIRNVALTGLESRNGYRYSEEALRGAIALYEGKPVFLDHARDVGKPQERSTRDLAGTVRSPRFEAGRVRADLWVNGTDAGRTLLALADGEQPGVGMSQVVLAYRSGDGKVVERIEDVISVDAVVFPATTRTFYEQWAGDDMDAAVGESSCEGSGEDRIGLRDGMTELCGRLAELERRVGVLEEASIGDGTRTEATGVGERGRSAEAITRVIAEAGIPHVLVTPWFLETLRRCGDERELRGHVEDRIALAQWVGTRGPVSSERRDDVTVRRERRLEEALIEAVRPRVGGVLSGPAAR